MQSRLEKLFERVPREGNEITCVCVCVYSVAHGGKEKVL